MTLATGARLGPYEIQAALGAGGMGEVYRARDTKLGRDVAIKVLPQSLRADAERLARFEREARLLASLNHPHIGAIYGLEDSNDVRGLILELVEGATLADRIARGRLSLDETLQKIRSATSATRVLKLLTCRAGSRTNGWRRFGQAVVSGWRGRRPLRSSR
jgi:serine/threonine protein kinase